MRFGFVILITGIATEAAGVLFLVLGLQRDDPIWRSAVFLIPAGPVLIFGGMELRRSAVRGWWLSVFGALALVPAFVLIRESAWGAVTPLVLLGYLVWVKDDLRLGEPKAEKVVPRRRANKGKPGKKARSRKKS